MTWTGTWDQLNDYLDAHPDERPRFSFLIPVEGEPGKYHGSKWALETTLKGLRGNRRQRERERWFKYHKGYYPFGYPNKIYHSYEDIYKDICKIQIRIRHLPEFGCVKSLTAYQRERYQEMLTRFQTEGRQKYMIDAVVELIEEL